MEGRDLNFPPEKVQSESTSQMLQPPPPTQPESQRQILLMPTMQPLPSAQPSVRPLVKPESTKARPRPSAEVKDGTPKERKLQCHCKYSRCLKLYCDCFASGIYCDGCNCVNCCNNVENEPARQEAVEATLERNPNAFRPKFASSPQVETIEMPLREIGVPEELLRVFCSDNFT